MSESASKEEFEGAIKQRQEFECLVNVYQHKEEHRVTIETSGIPVFDREGNWCGYRGIDRDVSEREQYLNTIEKKSFFITNNY